MSFITERYFQILENHKLYERIYNEQSLRIFVENHVICVWSYNFLLRQIHQELVSHIHPLNSQLQKEAIRLVSEIILEEEVEEQGDGSLLSHLEIYLEAMQDLGADISPIVSFFDLQEAGASWQSALKHASFSLPLARYARQISRLGQRSLHEKAAALFYEGEPFIPDSFLVKLGQLGPKLKVARLLDYFERHIEGLKRPGFSASGRLVEIFCGEDQNMSLAAEKAAEEAMKNRIELWNHLYDSMLSDPPESEVKKARPSTLKLVSPAL
ncbi:MAG: DUF3050 domain-containing protein [Proteobacteria bacterium]|nr:DUF3050 domain-containing protein [Pseudomonadota bacterium]